MRKLSIVTAALVAAVLSWLVATLPPGQLTAAWSGDPALAARTVHGAYHVHTTRSDGAGDTQAVARAAARAGIQFVIITDHGDATRPPDPPAYIDNVLVIDGVEISTNGGHYVALGLPAAPYPLGGEASAVVEDVTRLGGFGFAAHVDSARAQLAWSDWNPPVDGIEWLNADSEWRNESRLGLLEAMTGYLLRPGPALATILDRPVATLARWDQLAASRRVVTVAGHDAHGGVVSREEGRPGAIAGVPSYEASFRSFSTGAVLEAPLSGAARRDAEAVLAAFRGGRTFSVIGARAAPGLLDFFLRQGHASVPMGGEVQGGSAGHLRAVVTLPPGAEMVVVSNGGDMAVSRTDHYGGDVSGIEGTLRIEVRLAGGRASSVPWLLSNPIYFLGAREPPPDRPADAVAALAEDPSWRIEKDPGSTATLARDAAGATLAFSLRQGGRHSQFAALVADLPAPPAHFDRVAFDAVSDRPARVSVQLKYPGELRWARSVYLAPRSQHVVVPMPQMLPADRQGGAAPESSLARWILFVVDLTNMPPGGSGSFAIRNVTFLKTPGLKTSGAAR